jgi:hypothetical protein
MADPSWMLADELALADSGPDPHNAQFGTINIDARA